MRHVRTISVKVTLDTMISTINFLIVPFLVIVVPESVRFDPIVVVPSNVGDPDKVEVS